MRSELTSPSLLHKNQTPSKKCGVYGFNTTSTTSPSSSSSPRLNARREETTWTEYRVITTTARRVHERRAQPHDDFFAFLKVYFFLFFFTRTPLWHITSAKQHESTSTKRHHWDSGGRGRAGGRQDGGQVKGHVTVDDTTRRCESMTDGAKSDLLLTEHRQTADTSTSYTTQIFVCGLILRPQLHSLTYLCRFLYISRFFFNKGFGIRRLTHLHFSHLSSFFFVFDVSMQHKHGSAPSAADVDARFQFGSSVNVHT